MGRPIDNPEKERKEEREITMAAASRSKLSEFVNFLHGIKLKI